MQGIGLDSSDEDVHEQVATLLAAAGVTNPPVNIWRVVTHLGIHVHLVPNLPDAVSGFLYSGPLHPVIVLNGKHPSTRRRFTVAHELWHYLTGDGAVALHTESCQGLDEHSAVCVEERMANAFASALLVPDAWLRDDLAGVDDPTCTASRAALAHRYDISRQAMKIRLQALQIQDAVYSY